MTPSDRRLLWLAAVLLAGAVAVTVLSGCRGPDVFGVGAGIGRGDGGISGPLSAGGPPGPKGPSSGDWDTDSESWNVGAWVTWDLNPRKVEIVSYPPAPSWRAEPVVELATPTEGSTEAPDATEGEGATEVSPPAPDAAEPAVEASSGVGVAGGLTAAGVAALLLAYWPQIITLLGRLLKGT